METKIIKEFILDENSPDIIGKTFKEIYDKYSNYARNKNYQPVSKNKFSRFLKLYGFKTIVNRNIFTGKCQRIIIIPKRVLAIWQQIVKDFLEEEEKREKKRS